MNAMSAAADYPLPPAVEIIAGGTRRRGRVLGGLSRPDAAAILCSFNGVQHRAVVDVGEGNQVRPRDIADMLEALARQVRAS